MVDQIRVWLARWLSPEMYSTAVEAANVKLCDEVRFMAMTCIADELGKELRALGYTDDEVSAVVDRGADRASMAGDLILLQVSDPNVTPSDLLG